MHRYTWLVVIGMVLLVPASCLAFDVTLAWDPNKETTLAGYKVYYDTSPGDPYYGTEAEQGTSPITILLEDLPDQNSPEFTLTDLISGPTYYFAVTAFNDEGLESGYSNEVNTKDEDSQSGSNQSGGGGGGHGCFISTIGGYHGTSTTYE